MFNAIGTFLGDYIALGKRTRTRTTTRTTNGARRKTGMGPENGAGARPGVRNRRVSGGSRRR